VASVEKPVGTLLHFGVEVSELLAQDTDSTPLDLAIQWMREKVAEFNVQPNTPNYDVLLNVPKVFRIRSVDERRLYYQTLFAECLKQASA
jgi:hypothetical protein